MKSVVLFSGGYDSIAVALKLNPNECDLLFINYNQSYVLNEFRSAKYFAKEKGFTLKVSDLNLKTDQKMRNVYLIMEAIRLGYDQIYLGTRNILPIFDNYKDSNYLTLKILSYILKVKIKMPVVLYSKKRILKLCNEGFNGKPYNCYNNSQDFLNCQCKNCKEIRSLQL